MDDICFTVPGDPKSKGRPRFTRYGKTYTPKTTVDAEAAIGLILDEMDLEPFTVPVAIEVAFFCKTMRRTDGDNLMKLVLDACNKKAYVDDYLVEDVHYRVYRKVDGEEPRTEVVISRLD